MQTDWLRRRSTMLSYIGKYAAAGYKKATAASHIPQGANPAGRHIGELSTSEIKRASYPRISNLRSAGVALALNSLSAAYQPRIPALDFRGLLWGNALLTILYHKMYDLSSTLKYSTHWNNTNSINYNAP